VFVFYDTETTGLNTDFSQILQIALVFTDDDLNILATKKLACRNSPWVVPTPGALLTTGFSPDDLKFSKSSNYEMMHHVNNWLRGQHWPVTFVGYNSIGYDEPVLAQNFYQNLMDPGLTTSKNKANNQSNGRADVMHLVETVALYMPGALKLDILNYYKLPSLTLKVVAQQNGVILSDEDAHDALNDIKATVGVAKVIKKAAPQIWDQMMTLSTAKGVDAFLSSHKIFTYANANHYDEAARKQYAMEASVMTSLASAGGDNQALYDLRFDPTPYLGMSVQELKDVLLSHDRQKPLVMISKDKQPILMPMEMSDSVLAKTDDVAVFEARAKSLRAHRNFMANVAKAAELAQQEQQAARAALPPRPETLIDKDISAPVKSKIDQWMRSFNEADTWHDSAMLVNNFPAHFKDELAVDPSLMRFARLAERIVYEHTPQELSKEKQDAMKKHIAERVLNLDPKVPYVTIAKARRELQLIEKDRASGKAKWQHATDSQIRALKLYYTAIEKEYAAFAPAPPVNDNASVAPAVKKPPDGNIQPKP
jgi:exodeoxyribonuclease-1